jgi:hypothetical protein
MTSKKAKSNELIHKTDFTKYKPKLDSKTRALNQNTKRIDSFLPIQNLEEKPKDPKKVTKNSQRNI